MVDHSSDPEDLGRIEGESLGKTILWWQLKVYKAHE